MANIEFLRLKMQEENPFIERQLQFLMSLDISIDEIILRLEKALPESSTLKILKQHYRTTGKLSKALKEAKLFIQDPEFIELLAFNEVENKQNYQAFETYRKDKEDLVCLIQLLKTKLLNNLEYALILLVISTVVATIFYFKVIPEFSELFESFDVQLPALSEAFFNWNNQILNPMVIGFILLSITMALFQLLDRKNTVHYILNEQGLVIKLPFFKKIKKHIQNYKILIFLKYLLLNQHNEDKVFIYIKNKLIILEKNDALLYKELIDAKKVGALINEVNYQVKQYYINGEVLFTKVTKYISSIFLFLSFGYIASNIITIYLPIFQLGDII